MIPQEFVEKNPLMHPVIYGKVKSSVKMGK